MSKCLCGLLRIVGLVKCCGHLRQKYYSAVFQVVIQKIINIMDVNVRVPQEKVATNPCLLAMFVACHHVQIEVP